MDRTEVSAAARGGAVGVARGEVGEVGLAGEDLVAEVEEARGGVGAGGGGDDAAVGVLPGGLAAGALVLDEDVRRPHRLPLSCRRRRHADALPFSAADRSLARSLGWPRLCGVGLASALVPRDTNRNRRRDISRSDLGYLFFSTDFSFYQFKIDLDS